MLNNILEKLKSGLSRTTVKLSCEEAISMYKNLEELSEYQSLGSVENFRKLLADKESGFLDRMAYGKFFDDFNSDFISKLRDGIDRVKDGNSNIYVKFKFDWSTYKSWIVIEGGENGNKLEITTPQIPLIGGCWSDHVAKRMAVGQVFVSAMLESVFIQLEFIAYNNGYNVKVHKVDKCFYGPILFYTKNEDGSPYNDECGDHHEEYLPLLTENHPEAYKHVLMYPNGRDYWEQYHDK